MHMDWPEGFVKEIVPVGGTISTKGDVRNQFP
jgi:hypothetical protein